MASKEGKMEGDIESGQVSLERGASIPISSEGKRVLTRTCSGLRVQVTEESTEVLKSCGSIAVVIDRNPGVEHVDLVNFLEKSYLKKPLSKPNSTKHHFKPPRPPKGPFLYKSDMTLVKELSEIAANKRARIERVKALKKMKTAKASSSSSSATAMAITLLFFFVIILHGVMGYDVFQ